MLEDYWPLLPLFCHFYGRGERFDLLEDKVTITPDPSVPTPLAPLRLRLRPFGFTTLAAWRSSHRRIHHAFFGYVFPHASTNFKHWNPKIARRSPPCRPIFGVPWSSMLFSDVFRRLPGVKGASLGSIRRVHDWWFIFWHSKKPNRCNNLHSDTEHRRIAIFRV